MNLVIRVIRFITVLAFNLLIRLLLVLFRLLLPIVISLLRMMRTLVATSLVATVNGPSLYTEQLASAWTRRLLDIGVSRDYLDQVFGLCRFLATSTIVLGWVVTALISVAILRVVYGYLF